MNKKMSGWTVLAGRILLSVIFVTSGTGKLADWAGTAANMAEKGMPAVPFFIMLASLVEILGGLSLLAGFKSRFGALGLFVYLVPVTLMFHGFWAYQGMESRMQMIHFLKNLAIMGGLLVVAGSGPGHYSLDARK